MSRGRLTKLILSAAIIAAVPQDSRAKTWFVDPLETAQCKDKPRLKEISFPEEELTRVANGKIIATTRKGIQCVGRADVLEATDSKGRKDYGTMMVTRARVIKFSDIDLTLALDEDFMQPEGLKQKLIERHGPDIVDQQLTVIYFGWIGSSKKLLRRTKKLF